MTGEGRNCASEVNIAKNVENRFNRLNYGRHSELETNIE